MLVAPTWELVVSLLGNDKAPPVVGSAKERNELGYELLGLANVPESNVQFMIQRNSWLSGEVYDMYRHDYDKNNKVI